MRLPEAHWYPVLERREVRHKPQGVERLGRLRVIWRNTDGQPHARLDRCPHLGAALSRGRICGDRLTCPFHGFEFDAEGHCRHMPALGGEDRIPEGMSLTSFPLREAHGLIWLWRDEPREVYPEVAYFSQLESGVMERRWSSGRSTTHEKDRQDRTASDFDDLRRNAAKATSLNSACIIAEVPASGTASTILMLRSLTSH